MQPIHPLLCASLCNNWRSCERCTITWLARSPLPPTPQILARVPAFSHSLFAYYFIPLACFRLSFSFYSHFDDSDYVQTQWQEEIYKEGSHERKIAMNPQMMPVSVINTRLFFDIFRSQRSPTSAVLYLPLCFFLT